MSENMGMIAEHEPLPEDKSKEEVYQPDDKERKTIKLIKSYFNRAKKYRSKYDHKWLEYYEWFRGKQWKEARPAYRHSEVINFIFQEIQSVVPILTDIQPKVGFLPMEPGDMELSTIIEKIFDYDWRRNKWSLQLLEIVYESHIYGTAYGSLLGEVVDGDGKITFKSADPFYCFPDPDSYDVNVRGNYFIYAEPINLDKAKKKYKNFAQYIRPDLEDLVGPEEKTQLGKARFQTPTDKKGQAENDDSGSYDPSKEKMTLEITCWMRDDEIEESKEKKADESGEEKTIYIQKKKYPRGRVVKLVGGVLVEDKEYPYDDFEERFAPYARLQNYILPREFYGISEIEQLQSPQRIFNKLISFALDVLTIMGNPIWVVDTTANVDTDTLVNRPGLIVEKDPSGQIRREEGVQLQPYVLAMIDRMQSWFNEISGSTDITRGQKPEGVTAASAIRTLQEASQTRLRLKSRILDGFLQDIGQMYVSRMFQLYSAPKVFRITNDQNVTQYFKFSVEDGSEDVKKVFNLQEINEQIGQPQVESDIKKYETMGKFDVVITTGSALPFAKDERFNLAERLFNMGIIDEEEVLNAADYPNKEKILQRLQERKAAAAQAEMMQQQQQ